MRLSLKLIAFALASCALTSLADDQPQSLVNSLGLKMVFLGPGRLSMGSPDGEFDERPVHPVTITRPFYMAATEVTNAQYEQFDPAHKALRGKRGISKGDDDAVVFVSWNDAVKFCQWLSKKEGKPYRLPTEAEWEFACRAGPRPPIPRARIYPPSSQEPKFSWDPLPVSLRVGQTPANPWGLYDMHGNVEEWCLDTYSPHLRNRKRTRWGARGRRDESLSRWKPQHPGRFPAMQCESLRHPGRRQALADRVSRGVHRVAGHETAPSGSSCTWAREVSPVKADWKPAVDMARPYFAPPRRFVQIPAGSNGPLYSQHNHCPSVTWCDNGDLLAVWFSTNTERAGNDHSCQPAEGETSSGTRPPSSSRPRIGT